LLVWQYRLTDGAACSVVGSVNVVLLSHPDLSHLGALPYAVAKLGLDCPVYGTLPVFNMGQVLAHSLGGGERP